MFYEEFTGSGDRRGRDFVGNFEQNKCRSLRWLKVLFLGTLFLLSIQLILGWAASSVTLLAEAAHSGSDVVSYGLNWFIEWCKPSPGLEEHMEAVSSGGIVKMANTIDMLGCFASLLTLLLASAWAASEAWHRLQLSEASGSTHVGTALLIFAAISAIVNFCMLRMYKWQAVETEAVTIEDSNVCPPCGPQAKRIQVNFVPAESKCPAGAGDEDDGILASMHMVLHPGCDCRRLSTSDPWYQEEPALEREILTKTAQDDKHRNLNLAAAKLHLVSDMLRCILILVVASLIQLSAIHDVQYADAACGLLVSVLVCLGSMALLLRIVGRLRSFCHGKKKEGNRQEASSVTEPGTELIDSAFYEFPIEGQF